MTRIAFLDEEKDLLNSQQGYAKINITYDAITHKQTSVSYLDADGNTVN